MALARQTEVVRQQQIVVCGVTRDEGKVEAVKSSLPGQPLFLGAEKESGKHQ